MRTKTISTMTLIFLAIALTACSFSFSTANLNDLRFGKNETGG